MNPDDYEQLLDALDANRAIPTIVEGKNDKRALEHFGFSNVRTLDRPLFKVVEEIHSDEVQLLTDLDAHGRKLYHYFFHECARRGIKVNNQVRQLLYLSDVRQVEGLARYVERQS